MYLEVETFDSLTVDKHHVKTKFNCELIQQTTITCAAKANFLLKIIVITVQLELPIGDICKLKHMIHKIPQKYSKNILRYLIHYKMSKSWWRSGDL